MKNLFKKALFIILLYTASYGVQEYQKHIHTVYIPADWRPYYFLDENKKPTGFAIDLFEAIAKESKINYEYKIVPSWKELWPYLESGEAHIIPDLGITDKRKEYTVFSRPTNTFQVSLFKRAKSFEIKTIDDIKGKVVAVVERNVGQKVISKYKNINVKVFHNHFKAIRALLSGEVDIFVYPKPLMLHTLKNLNLDDKIVLFEKPLLELKRGIGISNKHKDLIIPINEALNNIKLDGRYDKIFHKWFDKEKNIELTFEEIIFLVLILLFIIFIVIFISIRNKWIITQKSLQIEISINKKYLQTIFDKNPDVIFTTDGEHLLSVNESFLCFVQFDSLISFKEKYECICDMFVKKDDYLTKEMDGVDWITYINNNPDKLHKAMIIRNEQEIVFELKVTKIDVEQDDKYLVILHDITLLEKIKLKLEQSNEDLQQFAYIASHDLQEPLRMVSSYLQLIERRYKEKLDSDGIEFISFAVDGAKRMQNLIDGLLQFSRVQTTGEALLCIDMNRILKDVVQLLSISIKEKNAIVKVDENLSNIRGDKRQIIQLFQNLIANSLKYCDGIPEIYISSIESEDEIIFLIKDNGIGIDEKYFEKIFFIFQRLHGKNDYKYGGSGIGLSICKRIMQRHYGRVWLESKEGIGTTFYLSFPKKGVENV